MHLQLRLAGWLLAPFIVLAASTSLHTRAATDADFAAFGRSIGLSESSVETLGIQYAQISNSVDALTVACQTARASLGEAQVEASPGDDDIVDENW